MLFQRRLQALSGTLVFHSSAIPFRYARKVAAVTTCFRTLSFFFSFFFFLLLSLSRRRDLNHPLTILSRPRTLGNLFFVSIFQEAPVLSARQLPFRFLYESSMDEHPSLLPSPHLRPVLLCLRLKLLYLTSSYLPDFGLFFLPYSRSPTCLGPPSGQDFFEFCRSCT